MSHLKWINLAPLKYFSNFLYTLKEIPTQGVGNPFFLKTNIGFLFDFIASLTVCVQNSFIGSALLYFKCLSKEASLYPFLASILKISVKNFPSSLTG
jgi:hypothetical protein